MIASPRKWPEWWDWELELTPHVLKRMLDRQFNEVDLRSMLSSASGYAAQSEGRFVVFTRHDGREWHVIVEPDVIDRVLVVITAYPCD
jgi:hypothetical protein